MKLLNPTKLFLSTLVQSLGIMLALTSQVSGDSNNPKRTRQSQTNPKSSAVEPVKIRPTISENTKPS
ncbi:MAG: hypothetical protein EBT92_15895, partial [Planctomycetes bacterium]|nr:hypothetical protein [Planctomycetota bacterium]